MILQGLIPGNYIQLDNGTRGPVVGSGAVVVMGMVGRSSETT